MNDIDALWAVCEREAQEFNAAYPKGSRIMVWNLETPRRLVPATLVHSAEVVGKEPSPRVCVRVTFDGPLVDIEHRIDASRVQCLRGSFADVFAGPVVLADSVDPHDHESRAEAGDYDRRQDYCNRVTGIRPLHRVFGAEVRDMLPAPSSGQAWTESASGWAFATHGLVVTVRRDGSINVRRPSVGEVAREHLSKDNLLNILGAVCQYLAGPAWEWAQAWYQPPSWDVAS